MLKSKTQFEETKRAEPASHGRDVATSEQGCDTTRSREEL